MSSGRTGPPGATRVCPHCRATILESASLCPACKKHLRFDPEAAQRAVPTLTPLRVQGTIRRPAASEQWEYSVVLSIRNARGEEISRQVIGVGALNPDEERTFQVAVEVFTPTGAMEKLMRSKP